MTGPTERTLKECRKHRWPAWKSEYWDGFAHKRKDLFRFVDVVVMDGFPGMLLVQSTTTSNMSARVHKIIDLTITQKVGKKAGEDVLWTYAPARQALERGNRIQVWGWAKRGPRGKRKLWTLRCLQIVLEPSGDLVAVDPTDLFSVAT